MFSVFEWIAGVYYEYNDNHTNDEGYQRRACKETCSNQNCAKQLGKDGERFGGNNSYVQWVGPLFNLSIKIGELRPSVQCHKRCSQAKQEKTGIKCHDLR